ncbi:hypothetical protein TEHD23766T_1813 [Tetragenococcus halophilus subsp. flandriensis]|nr:hypothetical protein TEHD23766T_1813 [Tetragenococcus halophilus subsp. flandriensis]
MILSLVSLKQNKLFFLKPKFSQKYAIFEMINYKILDNKKERKQKKRPAENVSAGKE